MESAGNFPRNLNEVPRLLQLINFSGYEILQTNGQRRYGPPPDWEGPSPPKGCEVFLGKLPRDCFEDEIVPFMEKIGRLYQVRLMMDFSGTNRGYAFVKYTNPEDAAKAVRDLNNAAIRPGRHVGVVKSGDNSRLFIGGLPRNKSKDCILQAISCLVTGVDDVILYNSAADKSKSRGFAFVEFSSHKSAAMARRYLSSMKPTLWGKTLSVDWAEPEIEVDEDVMAQVKVLYVRNLLLETSEDEIRYIFEARSEIAIDKVKKIRDFAFLHYSSREGAEKTLSLMDGYIMDGCKIEVTWAKPIDKRFTPSQREYSLRRFHKKGCPSADYLPSIPQPRLLPFAWSSQGYYGTQSATLYHGNIGGSTSDVGAESHSHMSHQMSSVSMSMPLSPEPVSLTPNASYVEVPPGHHVSCAQGGGYNHDQFMIRPVVYLPILMVPSQHAPTVITESVATTAVTGSTYDLMTSRSSLHPQVDTAIETGTSSRVCCYSAATFITHKQALV